MARRKSYNPAKTANKPKKPNTTRKAGMPSTKPRNPGPSRAPKNPSPNTAKPKNVGRGRGNDMGQPKSVISKPKTPMATPTPTPTPVAKPPVAPGPDRGIRLPENPMPVQPRPVGPSVAPKMPKPNTAAPKAISTPSAKKASSGAKPKKPGFKV